MQGPRFAFAASTAWSFASRPSPKSSGRRHEAAEMKHCRGMTAASRNAWRTGGGGIPGALVFEQPDRDAERAGGRLAALRRVSRRGFRALLRPELLRTPFREERSRGRRQGDLCPVSRACQCLEYALSVRENHGIWGGLNEMERRRVCVRQRAEEAGRGDAPMDDDAIQRRLSELGIEPATPAHGRGRLRAGPARRAHGLRRGPGSHDRWKRAAPRASGRARRGHGRTGRRSGSVRRRCRRSPRCERPWAAASSGSCRSPGHRLRRSDAGFADHPMVANGASDLFVEVLGEPGRTLARPWAWRRSRWAPASRSPSPRRCADRYAPAASA